MHVLGDGVPSGDATALSKIVFDKMTTIMKQLKINAIIGALDSSPLDKQMQPHMKSKAILSSIL